MINLSQITIDQRIVYQITRNNTKPILKINLQMIRLQLPKSYRIQKISNNFQKLVSLKSYPMINPTIKNTT